MKESREPKTSYQGYEDIIDLPHPVSQRHKPMDRKNRAAQFAPFAALTGYDEAIDETARLTDKMIELSDDRKEELDQKLAAVKALSADYGARVSVTYFVPDIQKSGGSYITRTGIVTKVDETERSIHMVPQGAGALGPKEIRIAIDRISEIELT